VPGQPPDPLAVETDLIVEPGAQALLDPAELDRLVEFVLRHEGAAGPWAVAIVLTTDPHLRRLHAEFMGIDQETDVMTFPAEPPPGEPVHGGDVVISADRAADQAGQFGHTPAEEARFLAVHGLLHLLGWRDETAEARASMLDRQQELIAAYLASVAE
jgi:probable rRNA maturation factor